MGTLQEPGLGKGLADRPHVAFAPLFSVGSPVGELNSGCLTEIASDVLESVFVLGWT